MSHQNNESLESMQGPLTDESGQVIRPDYWTTLSEYEQDEEFISQIGEEFYPEAKPERFFEVDGNEEALLTPVQRRTFLKMSGFAALAAALTGCERPVTKILPFVNQPDDLIYGVSQHFATTMAGGSFAGLLVSVREGRPIKLEGNPEHPMNNGSLSTQAQASLMSLYDPDRLKWPARVGRTGNSEFNEAASFDTLDTELANAVRNATGKVVLLSGNLTGPSNERLVREFLGMGENFEHVIYDPVQSTIEIDANEACFGSAVQPRYNWKKANVIICLGGDPMVQSPSAEETQGGIAAKRVPREKEGMSRLYVFEPAPTLTGMSADYRYPVRPEALIHFGLALAHEMIVVQGLGSFSDRAAVTSLLEAHSIDAVASRTGFDASELRRVVRSLQENPGRSVIYTRGAGAQTQAAKDLQIVANLLNYALGAYDEIIDISVSPSRQVRKSPVSIFDLVEQMKAGEVEVLLINGVNPVYTLPASVGFADAMRRVRTVATMSMRMDETSALADLSLPGVHYLESWGDAEPHVGLMSVQQPTIRVLFGKYAADERFDTRPWQESMLSVLAKAGLDKLMVVDEVEEGADPAQPRVMSWYEFVRQTWQNEIYPRHGAGRTFDNFWIDVVRLGLLDTVGNDARNGRFGAPSFRTAALSGLDAPAPSSGLVLVAQPTSAHGDGTSMENPYLLELPDPVSKVCWDNYASMSPARAQALGLREGDHIVLTANGQRVEIPTWIQPGMHSEVIMVHTGWGRNTFGAVGSEVGVNIYPLTGVNDGQQVLSAIPVTVERTRGRTRFANTQGHNYLYSPRLGGIMVNQAHGELPPNMETNSAGIPVLSRPIIGETTLNEWKKDPFHGYPNSVKHGENPPTLWERSHKYVGHHWGLTIDLNACNGCNACIIACNIENNIPVVGKIEVLRGREMHWLRIDRYYRGDKENPDFVSQPLMCQHCDNAPCETVCPVIATMHNDEGLNVMTYNRCVGTRYCANNCPYKVRRFNFWQYSDWRTGPQENIRRVAPLEMVLNPDVSVRTKGVMEKCTFCNTRIRHAKNKARDESRPVRDGEMLTACQQTCPAKAISFGDRNDQFSQVSMNWRNPRAYGLLEDMNVDPSVRYLALVRNRDEPSPYRTKYQQNRLMYAARKKAAAQGQHDHGHDH